MGYIRVSTDEQAREGISLEAQKAKIEAYCQLNDLELTGIIEDAGKSGKDLNRPGIQSLINEIKAHRIDAIVVYSLSRLSRRVKDTTGLMELLEKKSVAFHSITEKIDSKSAMGKFFLNIMASMNQWERDTISERTRDALQHKIKKNERAGQIPYGWAVMEDGKTLVENPREQKAVSLIRDLHSKGLSYSAICRALDKEGHIPSGKMWYPQSVKNIVFRKAA